MEISRSEEHIILSKLDVFFVELLRQIASSADPQGSKAARERLFSKPSAESRFNEDWKSYVQPELHHLFQGALDTIKDDLNNIEQTHGNGSQEYVLRIPEKHIDAWLNGLNQARLVIAARHGFTDKDMEAGGPPSLQTVRELGLFQIHFYGFLQECLLRETNEL